jgi:hypothetical protein
LDAGRRFRRAAPNPIQNLDIGGTLNDVTFHEENFNDLWDGDNDGLFGADGSVFDTAPTFWGNQSGAEQAADAIIAELGLIDETITGSDTFSIPFGANSSAGLTAGTDQIDLVLDDFVPVDVDVRRTGLSDRNELTIVIGYPYASFAPSQPHGAPVPFTPALLAPALLGIAAINKRRASRAV